MGTLVFVCPTTGHEVSTGVEVDRSSYKRPSEDEDGDLLSALSQEPYARSIWAWLVRRGLRTTAFYGVCCVDRLPCSKRSNPILAPFRSPSAMLWRGTPLA